MFHGLASDFDFLNIDRHGRKNQGLLMGIWKKLEGGGKNTIFGLKMEDPHNSGFAQRISFNFA